MNVVQQWRDKVSPVMATAIVLCVVSVLLNSVTWLVTRFFPADDPAAVLHYSIEIGIDFIGEGRQIMVLPLMGSLIIICNTVIGFALLRANWRAALVFWAVMPAFQLLMLAAFFLLWRINA